MRKGIILAIITICSLVSIAQKLPSNVSLVYDVVMTTASHPELNQKTLLNIFLSPTQSRSELISKLGTEVALFDNNSGKGNIIKEYGTQKLLITLTRDNWISKNIRFQNLKFSSENEVKTIGSYICNKAVAVLSDGYHLTVYFTSDIVLPNNQYQYALPGIKGLPVQYELSTANGLITYQLKAVSFDAIANLLFQTPQAGKYRIMSYEEAQHSKAGEK